VPRTTTATRDRDTNKTTIDKNIYAFDTESVIIDDQKTGVRYEPICFQMSAELTGESLVYIPPRAKALEMFINHYVKYHSWQDFQTHYAIMYAHNLVYDWGQLVKHYPDLMAILKTGIGLPEDYLIYEHEEYKVILRKQGLFTGTAPHFTIKIQMSKREWVDLMFRDTFSFFPTSLSKLSKSLGLEAQKMAQQEDIGKRDYRTEKPNEDKTYFELYSKIDAKATRLAGEKIRELHKISHMTRLRVSAAGFAINKLYHVIPEGTQICAGVNDREIMQLILDSYAGGRTGGIYHGKVTNVSVIDFHSSYPASMLTLPSFSPDMDYVNVPNPNDLTIKDIKEIIRDSHCFLEIDGTETDNKYPTFIKNVKGKLTPVYGEFHNIATTGVELSVGLLSGTLTISKVHKLVILIDMHENPILPFKIFIENSYSRKENSPKESVDYVSAKLEMNASYGKLIESRTNTPVSSDAQDIILPYFEGMETEFGKMYYKEYVESLNEESEDNFEDRYVKMIDELLDDPGTDPELIKYANFGYLSLTKLEYGRYVVPAAASLITATSRARLLAAMKGTGALYWDTDSLFLVDFNKVKVNQKLKAASKWLPRFIQPIKVGEALGDLDLEIEGASGYLAGTKRYFLQNKYYSECKDHSKCESCKDKKLCKVKKALHGIPTIPFNKASEVIENLGSGSAYAYEGNARPISAKESKTPEDLGKFVGHNYESKFNLDNRLNWEIVDGGWIGTIKNLSEMDVSK